MIPADFDPFYIVTGVKRRDWTKPVVPATPARARGAE
jgi:hypothetical protein